ncbi:hypothetical protein F9U64_17570 [Gracilibacillus oryzae]|uniref:Uncharacterized protein n=1 Tax=Gracilibacillus oryzae TaxID=1672701 RepID=A0A7C8GR98_9BACI|nr:hypothetical protein [Gracilibacillus oryzae]KAB8127456.1 hypothetical protein F9U64_17570 [Gracilibacillus oryzae]
MRQWRVGSISMGLTLVGLGIILFISQFFHWEISKIAVSWIPVLLIVLGIEILIYLFTAKSEQPVIKYDIFSILFIIFISFVSIGFYVGASSGVLAAVDNYINDQQVSGSLPVMEEVIDENVEKVVIDSQNHLTKVTATESESISIFGTYQTNSNKKLTKDQIASIHKVGETVYISLFPSPTDHGLNYQFTTYYPTISLPNDVDVEITGHINEVNLNLTDIQANWYVDSTNVAHLKDKEQANLTLILGNTGESAEKDVQKFGEGQYAVQFGNVQSVKELQ